MTEVTSSAGATDSASWVLTGPDGKIKDMSDPAPAASTDEEGTPDDDCNR